MKKNLCVFFLAFASLSMSAQEAGSFEAKTIELIKVSAGQQFEIMTEPLVNMVAEDNREAFKKDLKQSMEGLYTKMADIYMETFTEEEVDKILEFYDSPVGEKMLKETPALMRKGMEIGQAWAMELQPLMAKYSK